MYRMMYWVHQLESDCVILRAPMDIDAIVVYFYI